MMNEDTDITEDKAKRAAVALALGCLKNARSQLWLAEHEQDILDILGAWFFLKPTDKDISEAEQILEQYKKEQSDKKAELARLTRIEKERKERDGQV